MIGRSTYLEPLALPVDTGVYASHRLVRMSGGEAARGFGFTFASRWISRSASNVAAS